jgi:SAM-dependent methyltransferase
MGKCNKGLRIDIGCGSHKKEGTLGVDIQSLPGVDYVVNIETDPLPFNDRSVEYVYSSHFLEHIENIGHVFTEISRVCQENARLELWTPYAWSNSGFIYGHRSYFTEEFYLHMSVWYHEFWSKAFKARWLLNELHYVVPASTLLYLKKLGIHLDFALKHLHNISNDFGTYITIVREDPEREALPIKRTFSIERSSPRYEISEEDEPVLDSQAIVDAITAFSKSTQ